MRQPVRHLVQRSLVLLPLLCGLVLPGCGDGPKAQKAGRAQDPVKVQLAPPQRLQLPETIAVTGMLAPQEELVFGFQVAGRLEQLDVDLGDAVAAGATVAALDPVDFRLGMDRARAALVSARAKLGLPAEDEHAHVEVEAVAAVREAQAVVTDAQITRDRLGELVRQQLRSEADLDGATAALAVAQSKLQAARDEVRTWIAECREREIDLELAQKRARDSRLVAPWPAKVSQRHVAPGRFVAIGEAIVTLVRVDPLRLRLRVPERSAARAALEQRVLFTVDGQGSDQHEGRVARLGAGIDRDDRTLLVEAEVRNPGGDLRTGGFCRAQIVVAPPRPVLAVAATAVQSFAGVDRVFTVADGKAQEHLIELGRRDGDLVEVKSGLTDDARVVVQPRGLVQGSPVTVGD